MHMLVCLAALTVAQANPTGKIVVYNLSRLTDTCLKMQDDIERWQIHPEFQRYVFKRRTTWILLQQKSAQDTDGGTVWILEEHRAERRPFDREPLAVCSWRAWKGTYRINVDADDDELLHLNLLLLRRFNGHSHRLDRARPTPVEWEVDTGFECKAIRVNIPLIDRAVPERKIQMKVAAAVCVDKQGHQTQERSLPIVAYYPVQEKGKKLWADFICLGTELKAQPDRDALTLFTLPPGLQANPPIAVK